MTSAAVTHVRELPKLIAEIERYLAQYFPYMARVIQKRIDDFGDNWLTDFESELEIFFPNLISLNAASQGYGEFALDALRMQKRFDKSGKYETPSYDELLLSVYGNEQYMFDLYLPGILLSQFLWPHHYRQLKFFRDSFLSVIDKGKSTSFADVGVGTGFYSKEMLKALPLAKGIGVDISEHSLAHTAELLGKFGLQDRYETQLRDLREMPSNIVDYVVSVEVLEHLEDPTDFLKNLYRILENGGRGYITAAINAPNADHIYLYKSLYEVEAQICDAGFRIADKAEFTAFIPTASESVPSGGVFIVYKEQGAK